MRVADELVINIGGTFAMNGAMETSGIVDIVAEMGITMGALSSIKTTNDAIILKSNTNNINLGLLNAGTGDVEITATAGDILNNNGVFADITQSVNNVIAGSVTLVAANRIGASVLDAITLDINPNSTLIVANKTNVLTPDATPTTLTYNNPNNTLNLTFGGAKAHINNMQNTLIVNNSAGTVVVGLVFDNQIIGIGQNIGSTFDNDKNQLNEAEYAALSSGESLISVLGADYKHLFGEADEDEIVSTIIPSVPVLVKDTDGWKFVAPSRREILEKMQQNQEKGVKYIDWL
jgi:hypothetical protein